MFDKETIIVKSPSGISTRGVVEWLGQRSDADQLEVQSIVYRRTPNSPDEYLTVDETITARELWEEYCCVVPECTVIDYLVTTGQHYTWNAENDAECYYIGTRDEYADDLTHEALRLNGEELDGYDVKMMIDTDIDDGLVVQGILTGDLFKGDQ